jgi:hypothetical protein
MSLELPKTYMTDCPHCQKKVSAEVEANNEGFPDDDFEVVCHILARCSACYRTLVLEITLEGDGSAPSWNRNLRCVWPTPLRSVSEIVPGTLLREQQEAQKCLKAGAYTAAVVMVRRTLEGVCVQHGITKKPLQKAFQEMQETGLIEGRLLEWAQELRILGNEGAHFSGRAVSRQDAEDSLALAEALLDYLYVFSAQFEKFKQRRQEQKAVPDAG